MARVIASYNQKGGVGKSSLSCNLGAALAESGKKTLLMDIDAQCSLTKFLGVKQDGLNTINEVLLGTSTIEEVTIKHSKNLSLVPCSKAIDNTQFNLFQSMGRERILQRAMRGVDEKYDYVIIDCPPANNLMTVNALTYASELMIVLQPEPAALEGVAQLVNHYNLVKSNELNPDLEILGVVCNMCSPNLTVHKEVVGMISDFFGGKVFKTIVPRRILYAEATGQGKTILEYKPKSEEANIVRQLAKEVIKRRTK